MAVSVVIATYNAAAFVDRALQSALAQIPQPLEVIVVDDASTDETVAVLRKASEPEPRIKVIVSPENRGPSATRNLGFQAAKGDWIAVLDADDAFLPGRLARLEAAGEREAADLVADGVVYYSAATRRMEPARLVPTHQAPKTIDLHGFLRHARPFTGAIDWGLLKPLFRRGFIEAHGILYAEDCRHGEDFHLVIEALLAGARYTLIDSPGYSYTTRDSGFSRTRVDYPGMWRRTAALAHDPRLLGDDRSRRLIRDRVRALRRRQAEQTVEGLLRSRAYTGLLREGFTSPDVARVLTSKTLRRVRRMAGAS